MSAPAAPAFRNPIIRDGNVVEGDLAPPQRRNAPNGPNRAPNQPPQRSCCGRVYDCLPSRQDVAKFAVKALAFIAIAIVAIATIALVTAGCALAFGGVPFVCPAISLVTGVFVMTVGWKAAMRANDYINQKFEEMNNRNNNNNNNIHGIRG